MTDQSDAALLFCPPAIAIHNDGYVGWNSCGVDLLLVCHSLRNCHYKKSARFSLASARDKAVVADERARPEANRDCDAEVREPVVVVRELVHPVPVWVRRVKSAIFRFDAFKLVGKSLVEGPLQTESEELIDLVFNPEAERQR